MTTPKAESVYAFYADPVAWNSLPVHVREQMDFHRFKGLHKTHAFSLSYDDYWAYSLSLLSILSQHM